MKKMTGAFLALLLLATACKKKDDGCSYDACATVAPQAEISAVQSYISQNSITGAARHCSGAWYKILDPGTGASANSCSTVTATYRGTFTNGNQFDAGTATFSLSQVIKGWTNLVPLVKTGGRIQMFIPPSLAYGAADYNGIPGGSILVFDVTLDAVQ
ncbi:FKBP-type peptidyl-prolyl cis-trans isomerase [Flaviaesturariibacter aridisoli]|uniref:Peptidyl-prolyl cis-trans isomerase n=1 Tax=Flaviaesturariibacter aridisoli TaxID=2545761 RepID=A0A4R4E5V0_9BACT|nr:FKBP-type peptidyl-prolyl cis-trans isomerase [Flaviaesturariibacter aridisoli]TCZ74407.1 FKBP-type peptidylprolyl isomerase [Flaviaesturariibacter aridisoli]